MYKNSLAIMRLQPLHIGHERILRHMLDNSENVILLIGSSQENHTKRNPFDIQTRKQMVINSFKDHPNYKNLHIKGIPDLGNPPLWADYVLKFVAENFPHLPKPDAYYAGSEDTSLFENSFKNIITFYRNDKNFPFVSGSMLREMIQQHNSDWQKYIKPQNHQLIIQQLLGKEETHDR